MDAGGGRGPDEEVGAAVNSSQTNCPTDHTLPARELQMGAAPERTGNRNGNRQMSPTHTPRPRRAWAGGFHSFPGHWGISFPNWMLCGPVAGGFGAS